MYPAHSDGVNDKATIRIDDRNLPSQVAFAPGLRADAYGTEFVTSYGRAMLKRAQNLTQTADSHEASTLPSRRDCLYEYLTAQTWDEYLSIALEAAGREFRAESRFRDIFGTPAVVMSADDTALTAIQISEKWAHEFGARVVADEIVECANQIRIQRNSPRFNRDDGALSDEELTYLVNQHLAVLFAEKVGFETW